MKARVCGVQPRMANFAFIFRCILGYRILKQSDNLIWTFKVLQYLLVKVTGFLKISSDHFQKTFNLTIHNLFLDLMLLHKSEIGENDQKLTRMRTLSDWLKLSEETCYLREIYFAIISHVVNSIQQRFAQPDFKIFIQLQNLFS